MSRPPRILATSGGFLATDRYRVMRPAGLVVDALRLSGKDRPTVCLVMTASSDDAGYLLSTMDAFRGWSVDLTHLRLTAMPNADPHELLSEADVVWVGGGSVANLLALWRLHGVDDAMRTAWEGGTILAGVSAGSICWHVGGPTDSFGPTLRVVTDGLGFLPFGNGVHYDSEEQRRPLLHQLVSDGILPTSYATDDGIGVLYEGTEPVSVLEDSEGSGKAAYKVELVGGEVVETRLAPGPLP